MEKLEPSAKPPPRLRTAERFLALLILGLWLNLFASGILVDSSPFRCVISPAGVQLLQNDPTRINNNTDVCKDYKNGSVAISWFMVLFLFLPLNLALICITSGVLGTFGSIANLHDDQQSFLYDQSNPYISGLLRGFFVYLFFISGLLLFDDEPFSNPSPGKYIRLAGFLSLFSFVVNY